MTFPPRARIPFLVLGALCGRAAAAHWHQVGHRSVSALPSPVVDLHRRRWARYAAAVELVSAALTCLFGAPGVLGASETPAQRLTYEIQRTPRSEAEP